MSKEVRYNKSNCSIVLKPNTVTYVDENLVSAKELKDCYGDRVNIMSRETVERLIVETAPEVTEDIIETVVCNQEESESNVEPIETGFSSEEDDDTIEGTVTGGAASVDPLAELENLFVKEEVKEETPEVKEEDLVANTGNEEVDAFLNGETDELPEGTTEITEEEAKKLEEEVKEETPEVKEETPEVKEETPEVKEETPEVKEEVEEVIKPAKKATKKVTTRKSSKKK